MSFSEWREIKLGDLVDVSSSKRIYAKEYVDSGIPFYRSKEIIEKSKGNYVSTELYISKERFNELKNKFGAPSLGDILLTSVGTLGVPYIVRKEEFYFKDGNLTWIKNFKDNCHNKFIFYWLLSPDGVNQINTRCIGSTQKALTIDTLKKFELKIPPYEEQKAIARILSTLDEKIEVNNQINKTLENMAQAIFKQWFVDFEFPNEDGEPYKSSGGEMVESELGMIPKGWVVKELGDVVEFQNGYAFKSKDLLDKEQGDCYHVFKMGHIIKGGGLNKEGTKSFVPKKDCLTLARYLIKKGDLLMCMTDMKSNVALLGHTALMDEDDKYILNQRVGLLRTIDPSIINYPYLYILSNSKDFIENLRSRANSGVQVNLSTKEIKETLIIVPSKHIHKKYNDITEKVFAKSFNIAKENEVLKNARDTLLPKLMSGEIRVPFDEEGEVS